MTFAHRKLKVDIRIAEKQEGGGYLSRESSTHARTVISSAAGYFTAYDDSLARRGNETAWDASRAMPRYSVKD